MQIRYKIWLERNGEVVFGKGREELLRAIDESESLYGAAKKLKMSYRAAWGRLKASEMRLGVRLVQTESRGKGMHLTNEARALLDRFDKLDRDTASFLETSSDLFSLKTVKTEMKKIASSGSTSLPLLLAPCVSFFTVLSPYLESL